jgi:hypothetical protein
VKVVYAEEALRNLKARTDAQRSAMESLADDAEDLRRRYGV